jgi:hypothetical protein
VGSGQGNQNLQGGARVSYNLTDPQKNLLRWIVQENRAGRLTDEFRVHWLEELGGLILEYQVQEGYPEITAGALDALEANGLLIGTPSIQTQRSQSDRPGGRPKFTERQFEIGRRVVITARAAEAVDSDFDAPDESFMTQLTPSRIRPTWIPNSTSGACHL